MSRGRESLSTEPGPAGSPHWTVRYLWLCCLGIVLLLCSIVFSSIRLSRKSGIQGRSRASRKSLIATPTDLAAPLPVVNAIPAPDLAVPPPRVAVHPPDLVVPPLRVAVHLPDLAIPPPSVSASSAPDLAAPAPDMSRDKTPAALAADLRSARSPPLDMGAGKLDEDAELLQRQKRGLRPASLHPLVCDEKADSLPEWKALFETRLEGIHDRWGDEPSGIYIRACCERVACAERVYSGRPPQSELGSFKDIIDGKMEAIRSYNQRCGCLLH